MLLSQDEDIIILKPLEDQIFTPDEDLVIEWKTSSQGMCKLEYSINSEDWIIIEDGIEISDGEFTIPIDEIFKYTPINADGFAKIRLSKSLNRDEVNIKIPDYASHGSVTFYTNKNKKLKEKIRLKINQNYGYEIDKKIYLKEGRHYYESEISSYGSSKGNFVIQSGKSIKEEIRIEKSFGNIIVNSNISDVEVTVTKNKIFDSKYSLLGTKEKIISLKEGTYNFKVTKDGYRIEENSFTINPEKDIKYDVKLIPAHGSLTVNSYPQGANFNIEDLGIFNKTTPFTIDSVATRSYKVNFSLADHEETYGFVYIKDNIKNQILGTLKKHTGFLVLRKIDKKQKFVLKIDDQVKTVQNNKRSLDGGTYLLDIGTYKIEILEDGYVSIVKEINIQQGRFERIDLERIPIKVDVTLDPYLLGYDMTLFSSNKKYDNISINKNKNLQNLPDNKYKLRLPYGKYKIKSNFAKHESDKISFRINSPDPVTQTFRLKKKTSTKALIFSSFPGAGLLYSEKKRTALTFFSSTILSSLFTFYTFDQYNKKESELALLQDNYIQAVELEDIESTKQIRDQKQVEVNKLYNLRNQSIGATLGIYVFSIGITWMFNGL